MIAETDLISRQVAKNACHNWDEGKEAYAFGDMVEEGLQKLPSTQPEPYKEGADE